MEAIVIKRKRITFRLLTIAFVLIVILVGFALANRSNAVSTIEVKYGERMMYQYGPVSNSNLTFKTSSNRYCEVFMQSMSYSGRGYVYTLYAFPKLAGGSTSNNTTVEVYDNNSGTTIDYLIFHCTPVNETMTIKRGDEIVIDTAAYDHIYYTTDNPVTSVQFGATTSGSTPFNYTLNSFKLINDPINEYDGIGGIFNFKYQIKATINSVGTYHVTIFSQNNDVLKTIDLTVQPRQYDETIEMTNGSGYYRYFMYNSPNMRFISSNPNVVGATILKKTQLTSTTYYYTVGICSMRAQSSATVRAYDADTGKYLDVLNVNVITAEYTKTTCVNHSQYFGGVPGNSSSSPRVEVKGPGDVEMSSGVMQPFDPFKNYDTSSDFRVYLRFLNATFKKTGTYKIYVYDTNYNTLDDIITVEVAEHEFGEPVTTKEATCTETGLAVKTCSKCDDRVQEVIPKKPHDWGTDFIVDQEPTCTHEGKKSIHCNVCNGINANTMVSIPKIDHDWNNFYTVDRKATCTEEGSESIHCSVCGTAKEGSSRPIDKLPHNYGDWKVVKEPTCTEEGSKEKVCSACGDTVTETIKENGHTWNNDYTVDKPATCTEEGSESIHCSVCKAVKEGSSRPIDKLPHNYGDWKVVKEPTCTEEGSKEKVCSACGDTVTETIKENGHTWNNDYTVDKPATCTEEGSESIHCSICKAVKEGSSRPINKLPHNYGDWKVVKEPTCTEEGSKEKICSECGDTVTEAIKEKGHTWNEEYTVDKPATCTEEGSESIHCSVCDEIKDESARPIEMIPHEYSEWSVIREATTENAGLKERHCNNCDKVEQEEIDKLKPMIPDASASDVLDIITGEISENNPVPAATVEKQVLGAKTDGDPNGSSFGLLCAKGVAKSSKAVTVSWKKIPGATAYVIYGNKCGKANHYKKITTVSNKSFTQKKLKKGTYYKYIVVAVKGDKAIAISKTIHVATKGGKVGNSKSVTTNAKKNKVALKKGKSFKIKAKAIPQSISLKVKKHRPIAYESSNTKVATVSKKGVIKAKGKGTCKIFVYAQNGVRKKIKVTVK